MLDAEFQYLLRLAEIGAQVTGERFQIELGHGLPTTATSRSMTMTAGAGS
jgi:hypothetical protein